MFASFSKKLLSAIAKVGKRGILTEEVIDETIREIRIALLEADVALSVVKTFVSDIKQKLTGQKVISSITPEQTIIKIVHDELVNLLGSDPAASDGHQKRNEIMRSRVLLMVGLQGTGKTTTTAKLANLLKMKQNRKVLMVSLDTYRPAAIEQLQKLAKANGIDFFDDIEIGKDTPQTIAMKAARVTGYDTVIYDTAGRLHIDERLMTEVVEIKEIIRPDAILLVVDSMMGQDAVNTAKYFNEAMGLTGLILTRVDGDAKGGAALSVKSVTGCPIKYICVGEKIDDIEQFYPDRIASRILDKGDVMGLIEKAMDIGTMAEVQNVPVGKGFDLNGMEQYLNQLEKIGGISGFLKFIPGIGKIKENLAAANVSEKTIARQLAIIRSMTKHERKAPDILNASRRRRIAAGSGQQVADVNRLVNQFKQVKTMMLRFPDGLPGMKFGGRM
ncbi:MAG: signal recognition particle protein [Holosporales bacterium]|jgi:signal recognition particle subunit SRP54|nr:signal recognition particle protein [Holosporales bacterium]